MNRRASMEISNATVEEQIELLNKTVKAKIAPSLIHGVGVFAIREIAVGERMYCRGGDQKWYRIPYAQFFKIRAEVRDIIEQRWPIVKNDSPFLSPNSLAFSSRVICLPSRHHTLGKPLRSFP